MNLNELQKLMDDLARNNGPSHSDLESREEELRAAFDAHPEWTEQMRTRDAFDAKLCQVMPQVAIPEGLKERLLTALDESQEPAQTSPASDRHRRRRRRALLTMTVTGAMFLFAASVWMVYQSLTPNLTVADIEQELPKLWDAPGNTFPDADPGRAVLPPGWNSSRLGFAHNWKTHEASGESLAFRKLEFISDRGRAHTGLLASLPMSSFSASSLPASTDPFSDAPSYLSIDDGSMLAIVSWQNPQTEQVYFLAVPAEDHSLEALAKLLYVEPV